VTLEGGARRLTREATATASGHFLIAGLPPGSYRVRVHFDTDGDGMWDGGRLFPHVPPEPIGWLRGPVRVRARWEADLGDVRLENGVASSDGIEVDEQQDQ
jgi:uncharacterized protein (DUF2141 family)